MTAAVATLGAGLVVVPSSPLHGFIVSTMPRKGPKHAAASQRLVVMKRACDLVPIALPHLSGPGGADGRCAAPGRDGGCGRADGAAGGAASAAGDRVKCMTREFRESEVTCVLDGTLLCKYKALYPGMVVGARGAILRGRSERPLSVAVYS